jgi:hypothetical protein
MMNAVGLGIEAAVKLFNAPLANIAKICTPPHKIPGKKPSSIHCQVALPLRRFPIRPYWLILVLLRLNRYLVGSLGLIDGRDRMHAIVEDSSVRRKEEKSITARIGGKA